MKPVVLYICHNHPSLSPGGAETYALELHEAMRAVGEFEPILVARTGPSGPARRFHHLGTMLLGVDSDASQYLFYADTADFDWLHMSYRNKDIYSRHFRELLAAYRPAVVHFQHTLFFGYDLVTTMRRALPDTPILYTLHEYLPICHRSGQMLRTMDNRPCEGASPARCHECFPAISPQAFFLRKRFIQAHLAHVDMFLAPSRFLLEKYVDWGLARDRIRYFENGRPRVRILPESNGRARRNRMGFFGQFNEYKGLDVLLGAMQILERERPDLGIHLTVHGGNQELQPEAFRAWFEKHSGARTTNITFAGRYGRAELPALMALVDWVVVPSIWWENSPLVIQEAFLCGRPVICSDIGGMAEKVTDGVNGLHFRAGNAESLARAMQTAVESPGLWEQLRRGIPAVCSIEASARELSDLYLRLIAEKRRPGHPDEPRP